MNRKAFIHAGLLIGGAALLPNPVVYATDKPDFLMTVNGPIAIDQIGMVLPHEHVLTDFIGADRIHIGRYNEKDVYHTILPHMEKAYSLGTRTFVECTPAYLGRNVRLLQKLSKNSRLHVITNTGYYGANKEKHVPAHAYRESAKQLATRWTQEWQNGIDGTDIKPGFIKTGVNTAPLTSLQRKLVEAATLTHLQTGLAIGIHSGNGAAAMEEFEIIKDTGGDASSWIWIHAQNEKDRNIHIKMAREGAWISFDGLEEQTVKTYVQLLKEMKAEGLLRRVLISRDAG